MIAVTVPAQLHRLTGGRHQLFIPLDKIVQQPTLGSLLDCIEEDAPGMKAALLDTEGKVKPFISIFIGTTPAKTLLEAMVKEADETGKATNKKLKTPQLADIQLTGYEEVVIMPALSKKSKPKRP